MSLSASSRLLVKVETSSRSFLPDLVVVVSPAGVTTPSLLTSIRLDFLPGMPRDNPTPPAEALGAKPAVIAVSMSNFAFDLRRDISEVVFYIEGEKKRQVTRGIVGETVSAASAASFGLALLRRYHSLQLFR